MSKINSRESVKVAVRCRPLSKKELEKNYKNIIRVESKESSIYIQGPQGNVQFTYDYAFPENCNQEEIYDMTSAQIVAGVLEGYNGTIFAYGQTGTGKTYTMDGIPEGSNRGIVPRAFEHIFDYIEAHSDTHKFSVTVTYVELYNEVIRDLLAPIKDPKQEQSLIIHEDPNKGFLVKGISIHKANSVKDLLKIQKYGGKHRKTRATNMNEDSSRSHSILTLSIESLTEIEGSQHVRQARLNLVDLAGSERVAKTGQNSGEGFKEGVSINYALMILGNCISALTTKGNTHIPYRDSNLTKLLRDSLGGNAKTLMIAAIGPAEYNFSETMSTLRYAERAKKIENKPKVNMDPKDALLVQYQEELAALQAQLSQQGSIGAQVASSDQVIKAMEEKLEKQKLMLSQESNLAKEEREKLQQQIKKRLREIEKEKSKQEEYSKRLNELNKYLVGGGQELVNLTKKNEEEISKVKEKLLQREEKMKNLQIEFENKKNIKKKMLEQCNTINDKVKLISNENSNLIKQYQNLQLKLPEIQKTIQEDRQQLSQEVLSLTNKIDIFNLIIENFIPLIDVKRSKENLIFNEESIKWIEKEKDKKSILKKVTEFKKPKSANGFPRPHINSLNNPYTIYDEIPILHIKPSPIENKVKEGPSLTSMKQLDEEIEKIFEEEEQPIEVEIPF